MQKEIEFLVWYDKELKEIMSIEKINSTKALEAQLDKEGIQVSSIMAVNFKEANKKFVEHFETLKPDAQFVKSQNIQNMEFKEDLTQGINLDTLFDTIEARKPVTKKLH